MDELSNHGSNESRNCDKFDEDIFDDSSFIENLDKFDVEDTAYRNKGDTNTDLNVSSLCCDEELNGYDKLTGETWIYPTNYPVRDYQFNIIKAAMLENCLVSLPTGLGKTFIAAVIMYNFYRWYPLGKIIFTAPTRPLVAQQIQACYNIVAMPPGDTIEMTGQMQVNARKVHWQSKRVFFATPQVIYNDIKSGMCPGDKIRCLVFDEAHKARGNYAYGNIISTLSEMGHKLYRVLALSATPGNKVEDVIHVVKHLHISHLELRTENCGDVKAYSHARNINTVVVGLGTELTHLRQQYVEILDEYNRKLKNFNVVQNLGNLSKGRIVMLYKEFQSRERGARHPQHNYIMKTFTLLITLYHGLELLVKHGARVFLNFFDEHPEKTWVQYDNNLTSFFDKLRDQLGVNPLSFDRNVLPDGTIPEIPSNLNFGHPKFNKLKEIILEHFNNAKQNGQVTKAIVFCEYRESVNLVHCLLLQCRPLIVPEMFVGHGSGKEGKAGVSQKQQLRVMRKFRSGSCNTLVCTCVAEEGLDVGAVDLILCFDVSTRSPVRLVQRCGRTGRERSGRVFILVTEGREHTTLLDCMRQSDGLNKRILQSEEVKNNLYKFNPRMLPRNFMPECQKRFITVKNKSSNEKTQKSKEKPKEKIQKGQQDLRSMFQTKSSSLKKTEKDIGNDEWITKEEFNQVCPKGYRECIFFPPLIEYWSMSKESLKGEKKAATLLKLHSHLELQRNLQKTYSIGHSSDTVLLTELLQHKPDVKIMKSPAKKDGDIRVLFSKTTKSIKNYTKSMKELGIDNNVNISTEILNLLVDLSLENTCLVKKCYICLTVCNCTKFSKRTSDEFNSPERLHSRAQPALPDINLIDSINPETLVKLADDYMNNGMTKSNSPSESRPCSEYSSNVSSSKAQSVEILKKHDIEVNALANENVGEDDCLFVNEIFDIIDEQVATKSIQDPTDDHTTKRILESTRNNNNNSNIELDDTIIIESQEIFKNDKSDKDLDLDNEWIFENSDVSIKITESEPPRMPLDDVHTKRNPESSMQDDKMENSNDNAVTRLDNDKIIKSQEIYEYEDIFEDDVVLEEIIQPGNIDHTGSRLLDNVYNIKRVHEETNQHTINENSYEVHELEKDIDIDTDIGNQRINENDDIFEDDILDDEIRNNEDCTKSELTSNVNVKTISDSIIHKMDDRNDIYTICVLKYFHLNRIWDIFQCSDFDNFEGEENSNEKNVSLFPQTAKYEKSTNNNKTKAFPFECPSSPSVLSCRSISDRSTSPILISQKRKVKLSLNKRKDEKKKSYMSDSKPTIFIQKKTSNSPLTEPEHRKTMSNPQDTDEIIILDSDDDSFDESPKNKPQPENSANTVKRKFQEEPPNRSESPYFRKKLKLNESCGKPSTIKEKILAALTSHQNPGNSFHNDTQINFMMAKSPTLKIKKENVDPGSSEIPTNKSPKCKIDMLKIFEHRTHNKSREILSERETNVSRKMTYDDNDFVTEVPYRKKILSKLKKDRIANAKKADEFLDVEAELSQAGSASADEHSDDSTGSLIDFICDDAPEEDIHDIYLQSVKSPVKGVFKVPQLPPLNKAEFLSQYVEEDTYEMDSFCVDSHMVLNETNEMTELELAELILKERRKVKKSKKTYNTQKDGESSPIIKKNSRNIKRQIDSDSEDSS